MKATNFENYNPAEASNADLGLFGIPQTFENAKICIIPVPYEVSVSYRPGCALAPKLIKEESVQLDLYHPHLEQAWKYAPFLLEENKKIYKLNKIFRVKARKHIKRVELGKEPKQKKLEQINKVCKEVCCSVFEQSLDLLDKGKIPAVLGGDHSSALGVVAALAEHHDGFGILQIDAHMDLRKAYQGFDLSHASVMYNALGIKNVAQIVQIGVRDFSEEEYDFASRSGRVSFLTAEEITNQKQEKLSFAEIVEKEIAKLPQKVYISFDIDGLDLSYCRGTGTPVPGGLSYNEAIFLIDLVWKSGREIIGFDLCEVAAEKGSIIDLSTAARVLFRLSIASYISLKNRGL